MLSLVSVPFIGEDKVVNWFGKTEGGQGAPAAEQAPPAEQVVEVGQEQIEAPPPEQSETLEQSITEAQLPVEASGEAEEASHSLSLLSKAHHAIAEARSLDELKDIRDKAEAARKYAQAAGMGLEIQNYAAEVKLRAERRAGRLIAKLKLHGGDRSEESAAQRLTLADIGVSKDQSSRWQLTATVPEKQFENYVDQTRADSGEVTTAGLVRIARELKAKQKSRKAEQDSVADISDCLVIRDSEQIGTGGKFACVYVDPPWLETPEENEQFVGALAAIPVELAVEENAHIHLWARDISLFAAKQALENWGFVFQGCLLCLSPEGKAGEHWVEAHEYLLLGVRGELPLMERTLNSWMRAPREPNGSPSERVRKIVERVSPGPYLELFGRKKVSGWTIHSTLIEEENLGDGGSDEQAASA